MNKLLWFAFSTRVMVLVLQAVTNFIIPDHVANVFVSPEDANLRRTWGDAAVDTLLGGLKRWDAQYFIHIAQYGYTYENCLAFFPFFPLVSTRLLASASPVLYWIGSYKMNVGPTPTSDQNTINEHFRRIGI
ncbi:hypothetical protein MSG28_012289, partial [Choristoneura fumiferana]